MYVGNQYGYGADPIWLDDLQCTGNEVSLINCTHRGWAVHDCSHLYDVSIVCGDGTLCTLKYTTSYCVVNEYETSCDEESQDIGSVNCEHLPVRKWIVNAMLSIVLSSLTSIIDSLNNAAHHGSHRHT